MARPKHPKAVHQLTVAQFDELFKTEDDCIRYLVARRWPQGVRCPRCNSVRVYEVSTMEFKWQCYTCTDESYRFSHLTGTIFENTNKPLKDWYRVAHLMLVTKKGMSALQIFRYMGFGSYKTAWLMCHKIRTAMVEDIKKLGGIVEVDETYVDGSDKNRHWDKKSGQRGRGDTGKPPVISGAPHKTRFCWDMANITGNPSDASSKLTIIHGLCTEGNCIDDECNKEDKANYQIPDTPGGCHMKAIRPPPR